MGNDKASQPRAEGHNPLGIGAWRRWARFLCCFLAWAPLAVHAQTVTNLKVMSFNVLVGGQRGINNIAEVIRRSGADLVGLQEIAGYPNSLRQLATNLSFHYLPGISIVSRYPIVAAAVPNNNETQSGATIELSPGQRVHLFNCHLTAYPYGPYYLRDGQSSNAIMQLENTTRLPQLTNLLSLMRPYLNGPDPVFLTGDFNAPSHLDYAAFPWPTSVASVSAGLLDSYRLLHPTNRVFPPFFGFNDAGITWTPDGYLHEPRDIFDRIDFVYFSDSDGLAATSSTELDARNSLNPWPSDHRAVISSFTLTPPIRLGKASRPLPANGAVRVPLTNQLSWLSGSNATAHLVSFGTNSASSLVSTQTSSVFNPGPLAADTVYYWRVDEMTPSGVVTGDVWTFSTGSSGSASIYEWTFDRGDLGAALGRGTFSYTDEATRLQTTFGASDGSTVPHLNGEPVRYLRAPAFTEAGRGYLLSFPDSGPNGGGIYINRFTFVADILVPGELGWTALFNTNTENANDADFYVDAQGRLGSGGLAYSPVGTIMPGAWHRIAFVAELGEGRATFYRDGVQVAQRTGASLLDGRFSLYSNADAGADLLLFNEGNTGGVFTHELLANSIAFTDQALSAREISELGGAHTEGIFVHRLRIRNDGQSVRLDWRAGAGVRLQKRTNLTLAAWQSIPGTEGANSFTEALGPGNAYYRLLTSSSNSSSTSGLLPLN